MLEHMRLAKMSFDLWGALSPIGARQPPGMPEPEQTTEQSETKESEASAKRTMSQAELESSLYKVCWNKSSVNNSTYYLLFSAIVWRHICGSSGNDDPVGLRDPLFFCFSAGGSVCDVE